MQPVHLLYQPGSAELVEAVSGVLSVPVHTREIRGEVPLTEALEDTPDGATLYLLLDDALFKALLRHTADRELILCPLPWRGNPHTCRGLLLQRDWRAQLKAWQAADTPPLYDRLLQANGELVLDQLTVGQRLGFNLTDRWQRFRLLLRNLRAMRLRPFTLTTAKEAVIRCAALSLRVGEAGRLQHKAPGLCPDEPALGKVAALIYAPRSLMELFGLFWRGRRNPAGRLPHGIGLVKSRALILTSEQTFPYVIDGERFASQRLEIRLIPVRCRIAQGVSLPVDEQDREVIRTRGIPTEQEDIDFFSRRALPLFTPASEGEFADLFRQLRDSARFSAPFGVLLTLSVLLATVGLYQNAAPVIIGAMILAPLMAPIVSLSMGLIRLDRELMRRSARTVALGTLLSLTLAALFALAMPFEHLTDQMAARTHPNLLDLVVAILSGLAAAYAYSREEIAKSLAGVAIAVALVPPLAVAGIGLGWLDLHMFSQALLLFLTNLIGIVVAAGLLFYVLGFSSLKTARAALGYKLALLLTILIPLGISSYSWWQEEQLYQQLSRVRSIQVGDQQLPVQLERMRQTADGPVAVLTVTLPSGQAQPTQQAVLAALRRQLGTERPIEVRFVYR